VNLVCEETAAAVADPMQPAPFRVRRLHRDLADTFTMDLEPVGARRACEFKPGQFNMLYVFGKGEVPISNSGDPARQDFFVHTTRAVGPVSRALTTLKKGDPVGVRGPFGNTWPLDQAAGGDLVIVAGGVGLAPLRPVIYHVIKRRRQFKRVAVLYGARSAADLLYRKELEKWRGRLDLEVLVTVDRASDDWRGSLGVVTGLIPKLSFPLKEATSFICGPEIMMRFTTRELAASGVREDRQYVSLERNMKCGVGLCGHCQWGPLFVCKDGPVFRLDKISHLLWQREV
jgi:NAD(P)H-flavin reductase